MSSASTSEGSLGKFFRTSCDTPNSSSASTLSSRVTFDQPCYARSDPVRRLVSPEGVVDKRCLWWPSEVLVHVVNDEPGQARRARRWVPTEGLCGRVCPSRLTSAVR